jgi:serine/threonine protein kinase
MELLRGETLRKRLRRTGPLSCGEVLALLEQIAAGIDAAHAAGIVHRDLKTENVMLIPEEGDDARVVITDFGLAHQLDEKALRTIPLTRHAAGTLGYMAPEQLAGEQPRPATDIYALGAVLFELLTGELPFSIAEAIAGKGRRGPPPSLRSFCAAPPAWQTAIDRCLEVLPSARFGSAGELLSALRASETLPRRHRVIGRISLGAALTVLIAVLILGASVLAARRETRRRAAALKVVETPPARPFAQAVLPPRSATLPEVGPSARGGSAELPRSSPLGRSRHHQRRAGERSVPARTPETLPADDRLGDDDFVDPFVQPVMQPPMQPSTAPSHTK